MVEQSEYAPASQEELRKFKDYLEETSRQVRAWPEWKRELLDKAMAKDKYSSDFDFHQRYS